MVHVRGLVRRVCGKGKRLPLFTLCGPIMCHNLGQWLPNSLALVTARVDKIRLLGFTTNLSYPLVSVVRPQPTHTHHPLTYQNSRYLHGQTRALFLSSSTYILQIPLFPPLLRLYLSIYLSIYLSPSGRGSLLSGPPTP
jgi:hypothetical protein